MAVKNIDKLVFKYMRRRKFTQRMAAKLLGVTPQTFGKYKVFGIPDKHYMPIFKVLLIPSKQIMESLKQDFRL